MKLDNLINKYQKLKNCSCDITKASKILIEAFSNSNKLLVCGNGGSSSDSDHIVGELMKSFMHKRPINKDLYSKIEKINKDLANNLQVAFPTINLSSQNGLITAYSNDNNFEYVYAQQVLGYGSKDDVLLVLSTSGNSKNIIYAIKVAKILGLKTIALTGSRPSALDNICDVIIKVDETETFKIQELHLPIYHYLCSEVENYFFPKKYI